ncbi:MAG: HAMP domain-containing histidine kinase [Lachnospiraceae bacterium]|nr:HAMP domain-containing histidine kinase [Lachnospiraceae bacterium]
MIKKIRSKLSVKLFLLTAILMAVCCTITYLCIAHFAPYVYSYDLAEVEELADILSEDLSVISKEESQYLIQAYNDILVDEYDDEFAFHLFRNSGEEIALSDLEDFTSNNIDDYKSTDTTKEYEVSFADSEETYILLLAKNMNKESQVVLALQKTLPILSVIVLLVSVIAAFFYTWYMTEPIKKISRLSKQMADMDFSGLCPTDRTDEIGVLSYSLNDLSKKLVAALSELQEANQKLQADIDMERRLEKQRVEFFAAASHELKTPITIIKGQLQGMLYEVGRYKDRETYLAQSLEVTDTLEKMVQELLVISRLDTPGYTCKKCNLNLSKLISDRLAACEDLFMQKDLTVEKSISPEVYILGDIQLIQKVLDNLFGNASAYSEAGNEIIVKLWKEAEKINLAIENTGAYIPDENIPKLFEAFYRVDQSRNRQTGGTGLGLYIVKTILDMHGAEIKIANTVQGVIVFVQF